MYKIRLIAAVCSVFIVWGHAWGQTDRPMPADVRVVIDVSGSMKQNDPNNLRRPALELLVQLLPEGSKAGVWTFGRYVNMMVPHQPVTTGWRKQATAKAAHINSLGLFTNIGEALQKAGYDLDRPSRQYRTSLILLTDGMVDISRSPAENQAEWRRIVGEVLPRFQQAGYTVHTIALSDDADIDLLGKLALATDGIAAVAKTADDLMKIFLNVFDQAVPAEQVPLEENRFVIDSSIEEFTALIFRQPGSTSTRLIGPDDHEYSFDKEESDVNWYRADDYDLITVQRPVEGEWQVRADMDPDSRVTVVSDLKLLVKPLKNNLFRGEALDLSLLLQEKGKTITRTDFLQLLDITSTLTHREQNRPWEQSLSSGLPPVDGIYSTRFSTFDSEGHYDLKVRVDGKSFKREFSHTLTVREPFGVDLEKTPAADATSYTITVKAYSPAVAPDKTQVVAQVRDPEGRSSIRPLQATAADNWRLSITPAVEGEYTVALQISGTDKRGQPFEFTPAERRFRYPDTDDPFAVAKPASEPEPVPASEPEPEPESKPEPAPEPRPVSQAEGSKWPLYVGLAVGNLLILVLAYFAYRMVMGGGGGDSLKDLERAAAETEAEAANTEPTAADLADAAKRAKKEDPEPEPEPEMDEVAAPSEPSLDELSDEIDSELAGTLMDDDLDLASETSADADIDMPDEESVLDLLEENSEQEDDNDMDTDDFSLDDFAADDDLDDDKDKI